MIHSLSVNKKIKTSKDLEKIDIKKLLSRLLNVTEKDIFPIPENSRLSVHIHITNDLGDD